MSAAIAPIAATQLESAPISAEGGGAYRNRARPGARAFTESRLSIASGAASTDPVAPHSGANC